MSNDYDAALTSAALFEIAGTGFIEVRGPDAASFLNGISTNDIVNLPVGESCETFFCDHRAKVLFQANATKISYDVIRLDTFPGYVEKLLKHLDRYLISEAVELHDGTQRLMKMHFAGPKSFLLEDDWLFCNRHDSLGVPGFDIHCTPSGAKILQQQLEREAGAVMGSPETFNTLRIEAGTPIYGIDIDENRFVMEVANAARAVCYTKGCFIGQEPIVMSRDRAGQVNRLFLGMKVQGGGPLAHGTKLFRDGVEVGIVTSSCLSPRLGMPIALGYLKRPHIEKGLILTAGSQTVEVLGYPPLQ